MDISGFVLDIVGLLWICWVCNGYSGSAIDKEALKWIKWVCNEYSGSVLDIVCL